MNTSQAYWNRVLAQHGLDVNRGKQLPKGRPGGKKSVRIGGCRASKKGMPRQSGH